MGERVQLVRSNLESVSVQLGCGIYWIDDYALLVQFSIYAAIGREIVSSKIFSSLSLFNSSILGLIIMPNVARNFSGTNLLNF